MTRKIHDPDIDAGSLYLLERGEVLIDRVVDLQDRQARGARRKHKSELARLHALKAIDTEMLLAGERYAEDHHMAIGSELRAQSLDGRVDGSRSDGMTMAMVAAKQRLRSADAAIGNRYEGIAWHVAGFDRPLANYCAAARVSQHVARNMLCAALNRLVGHYRGRK